MSIQIIGGGSDLNGAISTANNNFRDIQGDMQRRVIYDDQGTRVVMLDKDGLKATAPGGGIDVFTATDSQLTFNSARNQLKVILTKTVSVTKAASSTQGSFVYTHNLGYPPAHMSFYVDTGLSHNVPFFLPNLTSGINDLIIQAYTTNTTYEVFLKAPSGGLFYTSALTVQVKFYLLQETAAS